VTRSYYFARERLFRCRSCCLRERLFRCWSCCPHGSHTQTTVSCLARAAEHRRELRSAMEDPDPATHCCLHRIDGGPLLSPPSLLLAAFFACPVPNTRGGETPTPSRGRHRLPTVPPAAPRARHFRSSWTRSQDPAPTCGAHAAGGACYWRRRRTSPRRTPRSRNPHPRRCARWCCIEKRREEKVG
jgi:hypothetical protein